MRLFEHPVMIRSGVAALCDPGLLSFDYRSVDDAAGVELLAYGDGTYSVYSDGECFYIDVDPQILKAKTRAGWTKLAQAVGVDTARVGVVDVIANRQAEVTAMADSVVILKNLQPGPYVLWFEEKVSRYHVYRGVIGFGRASKMILNGPWANRLRIAEHQLAQACQTKGPQRHQLMQELHAMLLNIHWEGCKDPRLPMIASAARLHLPKRIKTNRPPNFGANNRQ